VFLLLLLLEVGFPVDVVGVVDEIGVEIDGGRLLRCLNGGSKGDVLEDGNVKEMWKESSARKEDETEGDESWRKRKGAGRGKEEETNLCVDSVVLPFGDRKISLEGSNLRAK